MTFKDDTMKQNHFSSALLAAILIFILVFCVAGCKSNDVDENREAYEQSIGGGDDDSDDHGNTTTTATTVQANDSQAGTINDGNDEDYFEVYLSSTGTFTVYTTGSTDTYGYLYNSSGNVLASNDDSGTGSNFKIEEFIFSTGTYYIKVKGYSSSDTGSYTLVTSF